MKFWMTDPSCPDRLMIDMIQCEECDRWLPLENEHLHALYHQQQQQQTQQTQNHDSLFDNITHQDDASLPVFVMESIPCHDCLVLVPKDNWEIHKAHVCRGRQRQRQDLLENEPLHLSSLDDRKESIWNSLEEHDNNHPATILQMETVECEACGILVPIHNLELHVARACTHTNNHSAPHLEPPFRVEGAALTADSTLFVKQEAQQPSVDLVEEWHCPRCTFWNQQSNDASNDDWKCSLCGYSLSTAMNQEDPPKIQPPNKATTSTTTGQQSWQSVLTSWVPQEYRQLLPKSFLAAAMDTKTPKRNKSKKRQRRKPSTTRQPPCLAPSRQRVRAKHLDWLEREQQQYMQLLRTTRQEQKILQQQEEEAKDESTTILMADCDIPMPILAADQSQNPKIDDGMAQQQQQQLLRHQTASTAQQLELLQATEQLCLYHLEHIRRTRLIQDLTLDIDLLGLDRWKRHLHHLLDLYQSASEVYVDTIIWEVRMHFMQYATMEVMALLELAIWKAQIQAATTGCCCYTTNNDATAAAVHELRWACRHNRDISTICQSVLPFLGRPQTPALRAM